MKKKIIALVIAGVCFARACWGAVNVPVTLVNASIPDLCAEHDNVYYKLIAPEVNQFEIEALHPWYLNQISQDQTEPDFRHCTNSNDPVFYFTPRTVKLYDDGNHVVLGETMATFYRTNTFTLKVGARVETGLHVLKIHKKIPNVSSWPQILVVYGADGYWRAKPFTVTNLPDTVFGSSFLIGPMEEELRPVVNIRQIEFVPSQASLLLEFASGGAATVKITDITRQHLLLKVNLSNVVTTTNQPRAALRSMYSDFLAPTNCDVEVVSWRSAITTPLVTTNIMLFSTEPAAEVIFARTNVSRHNTSAPDIRFGSFRTSSTNLEVGECQSGEVMAWGDNRSGQINLSSGLEDIIAVSGGTFHTLALRCDGTLAAFGWNAYSQAVVPDGLSNVVAIAAGAIHNLALKEDGTVFAWGDNALEQTNVPADLSQVVAIAAGGHHNLALKRDGTVVAWGYNSDGQTDVPAGLSDVVAISAGAYHSLALKSDGTAIGWGANYYRQADVPAGLNGLIAIAAGDSHSLALRTNGAMVAWGDNFNGQTNVPADLTNIVAIAAGYRHNLALRSDGTVAAWGYNLDGETNVPVSLSGVMAIAAASTHDLALVRSPLPAFTTRLFSPSRTGNQLAFNLVTRSGGVFRIEYKNALTEPAWTPLPLCAGLGRMHTLLVPALMDGQRFYRVQQW